MTRSILSFEARQPVALNRRAAKRSASFIGRDGVAARIYKQVLGHRPVSISEAAEQLGLDDHDARAAMVTLQRLKLVRAVEGHDRFVAVCPDVARAEVLLPLEQAIHLRHNELTNLRRQLEPLAEAFDDFRAQSTAQTPLTPSTAEESRLWMARAARECLSELLVLRAGPTAGDRYMHDGLDITVVEMLDRGIKLRLIYLHTARTDPAAREFVAKVRLSGGQVRTVNEMFGDMAIFDRQVAFVPSPEFRSALAPAAILREPLAVGLLGDIHDRIWEAATEFDPDTRAYGQTLEDLQMTILHLLASGLTDDTIARRLGISSRTCRRHSSAIMADLQASSRFQAGAAAALTGLLDSEHGRVAVSNGRAPQVIA